MLIEYSASDACGSVDITAVIALDCPGDDDDDDTVPGDPSVADGQVIELECDDDDCEVEFDDDGILEIESNTAVLIVTATDECGNTTTCTVELCPMGENDD